MSILDSFEVLEVPRTFSIAEVRILKNRISFNMATASEIGYPPYVRLLISQDRKQLALQPCDKTTPNAMRFFTVDERPVEPGVKAPKRKTVSVGTRALAALLKSGIGKDMSEVVCAPGLRLKEENVIIFDFAQCYGKGQKPDGQLCLIPRPSFPFATVPTQYFASAKDVDYVEAS